MNLEERTNQLFVELMTNPQITSKELCQKFELTRGQLNYALQKINSSLEEEKLKPIKRTKNGHFIISSEVFSYVKGGEPAKNDLSSGYVFSSDERVDLIQLRLLSKDEYLSLNHFIDELEVSRNTVLRDLKEVDQRIEPYSLKLVYSRKDGYYIQGDEWDKRKLLSDLLITVGQNYHGIDLISKYANIEPNAIETMKKRVELVEQDLGVQFTDEWLKILPLLLILLIRRAQKGRLISYSFKINEAELSDTKEYLAADRVIWDVERLTENERVYLTMVLLTANLSRANILSATEISNMKAALEAVIEKFSKIVGIQLKNKEVLLNRLLVHMRPAYYRIKYHLNLQTKYFQENTDKDLSSLFYLVKKASGPLTDFFKEPLPDAELFMISLFIGSHMVGTSDIVSEDNRIKAIIVCPNGVSIATMLEHSLRKLLPEVNFVAVISAREFYKNTYDADYVFSPVPLKTDKQVFVVNSFLTAEEKKQLRQKFLRTTYAGQTNKVTPENILEVIEKHTTIKDEGALYEDVLALFNLRNP
ncbi:PRD domain-containing protein [Bavariicoccus seileri]|uniref:PRD domain-containing protein n=1 Tax=Bavariicoccus seileri TaxID=549685 RepID=UPI0003B612BC